MTLVLKKFLAVKNLNSPFLGGLNSYGLIILIIAFLNLDWAEIYTKEGALSAGRALKWFLYYYGKMFEPNHQMINDQQYIVTHVNYSSILIIQDPLNPLNNIGKSTFNFDTIRAQFSHAFDEIEGILGEFMLDNTTTVGENNEGKEPW